MNELDKVMIPCGVSDCSTIAVIQPYTNVVARNLTLAHLGWRVITPDNLVINDQFALCPVHTRLRVLREQLDDNKALRRR